MPVRIGKELAESAGKGVEFDGGPDLTPRSDKAKGFLFLFVPKETYCLFLVMLLFGRINDFLKKFIELKHRHIRLPCAFLIPVVVLQLADLSLAYLLDLINNVRTQHA